MQFRTFCSGLITAVARALSVIAFAHVFATFSTPLGAQVDVIRGRVTSTESGEPPLESVTVRATSVQNNVTRAAITDRNGRFTITFAGGTGDYSVTFTSIGFSPRRYELKRGFDEAVLVIDARLSLARSPLDTVLVTATSRAKPFRNDSALNSSGGDQRLNTDLLAADQLGELAALAGTAPGVLYIPGANGDPSGFSVFGLDASQNLVALNGLAFGGAGLPRDANVSASLATSPYDVAQGGFSGGRLNISTAAGSNFSSRSSSLLLNVPQLQWTDRVGQALAQRYTRVDASGSASGPIVFNKAFYNIAYQLGRRYSDLPTMFNTSAAGLNAIGIATDSVSRLRDALTNAGIPIDAARIPSQRTTDQGLLLAAFDFAPPTSTSGQAFNVTVSGAWNSASSGSSLITAVPTTGFSTTNWNAQMLGRHTNYYGSGFLSETAAGIGVSRRYNSPFVNFPVGSVLVHSSGANGSDGLQRITFGGTTTQANQRTTSLNLTNQVSWFSLNNKHRIRTTTELRQDSYSQIVAINQLGTFVFNSLTDLRSSQPASFTRSFGAHETDGSVIIGGVSIGDTYRANDRLQIQYGVRADASRFLEMPAENPEIEGTFGSRNDRLPTSIFASPRIGFTWSYGTLSPESTPGSVVAPLANLRGGLGIFQNNPGVSLGSDAMNQTGLSSAIQQLTCVGGVAPIPNWTSYGTNQSSLPEQCDDGSGAAQLSSQFPDVTLFRSGYAPQRSFRSSLQWRGAMLKNHVITDVTATYSRNLNQAGFTDVNLNPVARFALASEGDRPVYVDPAGIVPATGSFALTTSRLSPKFNHVNELNSDLHSTTAQLSIRISPLVMNSRRIWGVGYTFNRSRETTSGFASTGGDPFLNEQSRASADWRHQVQFNLGYNLFDVVRVQWAQSFLSALPFTPMVAGDINGDGYDSNDRAFIYGNATAANPGLATGMSKLLQQSSPRVRDCLRAHTDVIASRNSCEGSWSTSTSMMIGFNPVRIRLPQRATLSFSLLNPLGAADLLLHGSDRLHGWGQSVLPDSRLLFVRGFDAQSKQFKYDVNERFGSSSQRVSAVRNPVAVTALLKVDIGPSREKQGLEQTLAIGRKWEGDIISESVLKSRYGTAGLTNPFSAILRAIDIVKLTGPQADSIATLNRWYLVRMDSIWTSMAHELAATPKKYDGDIMYREYREARSASVDLLIATAPGVRNLLTVDQLGKLPPVVVGYLDTRFLRAVRAGATGVPGGVFAPFGATSNGTPGPRGPGE